MTIDQLLSCWTDFSKLNDKFFVYSYTNGLRIFYHGKYYDCPTEILDCKVRCFSMSDNHVAIEVY